MSEIILHAKSINKYTMIGHTMIGSGVFGEEALGPELSTGRMDPRVGSGRVTILPDFGGSGRVSTSDFSVFY